MSIENFEQLEVWQLAHRLVLDVYRCTTNMPSEEKFGLISQMRQAAVSVPANIAEGFKRRGTQDKKHYYNIAQASLEELRYYFILCRDLSYKVDHALAAQQANRIGRMLNGLISSVGRHAL